MVGVEIGILWFIFAFSYFPILLFLFYYCGILYLIFNISDYFLCCLLLPLALEELGGERYFCLLQPKRTITCSALAANWMHFPLPFRLFFFFFFFSLEYCTEDGVQGTERVIYHNIPLSFYIILQLCYNDIIHQL